MGAVNEPGEVALSSARGRNWGVAFRERRLDKSVRKRGSRLSRSSAGGDDSDPVCARRGELPCRGRSQSVRSIRQCVSGYRPALDPDRCRPFDNRQRIARDFPPDPDRRRDRRDARQARRHRSDDGGDDGFRDHHLCRPALLADGVRLERAGGGGRRFCSRRFGPDPRPRHERQARAAARPQLGLRSRRQHRHCAPCRRGRLPILAARRLSHGSSLRRSDCGCGARHSGESNQS